MTSQDPASPSSKHAVPPPAPAHVPPLLPPYSSPVLQYTRPRVLEYAAPPRPSKSNGLVVGSFFCLVGVVVFPPAVFVSLGLAIGALCTAPAGSLHRKNAAVLIALCLSMLALFVPGVWRMVSR